MSLNKEGNKLSDNNMKLENIIANFLAAKQEEGIDASSLALKDYFSTATETEKSVIQGVIKAKSKMFASEAKTLINESQNYVSTSDSVIDLNEWVTIKNYVLLFKISSTHVVSNWIRRGIIPSENVRVLPMLNDLKLIKAVKYL
jgi:hypothetical protein